APTCSARGAATDAPGRPPAHLSCEHYHLHLHRARSRAPGSASPPSAHGRAQRLERAELDVSRPDHRVNPRVAQRLHLQLALLAVGGRQIRRIAGMAAELGDARSEAGDDLAQRVDRDSVGKRFPSVGLAEERTAVSDRARGEAERDAELVGELEQDEPHDAVAVDVLVRVEMRRVASDEAPEGTQLALDLRGDGGAVVELDAQVGALPGAAAVDPL